MGKCSDAGNPAGDPPLRYNFTCNVQTRYRDFSTGLQVSARLPGFTGLFCRSGQFLLDGYP